MKELKGTEKRNFLVDNEKKCQARWAEAGIFESNAPSLEEIPFHSISNDEMHSKHPKFFGLMAYPYVSDICACRCGLGCVERCAYSIESSLMLPPSDERHPSCRPHSDYFES